MVPFGEGERYNITGLFHDESGFPTNDHVMAARLMERLLEKISANYEDIVQVEEYKMEDAETAVICFGGTTRSAKEAVREARSHGIKAGLFRPITVWTFPERELRARLPQLNNGQMLLEVQRVNEGQVPVDFIGRIDGTLIRPDEILQKIREA